MIAHLPQARRLALVAALAAAIPAAARGVDVVLYPLDGNGVARDTLGRLHELIVDGALQLADESERFQPRQPMLVARACGSATSAAVSCLAKLAAGGVLVEGDAERQGDTIIVTLRLVDSRGRVSPAAWFRMNRTVLTTGPVVQALRELDAELAAGKLARPSPRAAAPPPRDDAGAPPEVMPGWREKPAPPPQKR